MIQEQEAWLTLAPGRKGVGKSYTTERTIDRYIVGNPSRGAKPRRALILDINDEFGKYRAIALKDIRRWCLEGRVECRRVRIFHTEGDKRGSKMSLNEVTDTLHIILENYFRGLLLVEDINKYVSDAIPADIIGAICTQRHVAVDVIAHFQGIGRVGHPKLWSNANMLRFHKTDDTIDRHANKFEGYIRPLKIMETMINIKFYGGNKHFYCWFNKDTGKIFGSLFNRQDFSEAVDKYLEVNYRSEVGSFLSRVDLDSGKLKYQDRREGIRILKDSIFADYYGNAD